MYDGLLLRAVLEHLYDPIDVLKDCAKVIRKDGLIFIDVPHYKGLSTRYKKFLHRLGVKKTTSTLGFLLICMHSIKDHYHVCSIKLVLKLFILNHGQRR